MTHIRLGPPVQAVLLRAASDGLNRAGARLAGDGPRALLLRPVKGKLVA